MKTSIFKLTYSGTIGRLQYLGASAMVWTAMILAFVALIAAEDMPDAAPVLQIIGISLFIATFVYSLSISVRRMRDTGASPWLVLTLMIPYLGILTGLILFFAPANTLNRKSLKGATT
jgi:uncharacterized membrane protein YhaH (DUF805 family)